jgi:hypothetical protein
VNMKKFAAYLTATFGSFYQQCDTDFTVRHDGFRITQVLIAEDYKKFALLCAATFFFGGGGAALRGLWPSHS